MGDRSDSKNKPVNTSTQRMDGNRRIARNSGMKGSSRNSSSIIIKNGSSEMKVIMKTFTVKRKGDREYSLMLLGRKERKKEEKKSIFFWRDWLRLTLKRGGIRQD